MKTADYYIETFYGQGSDYLTKLIKQVQKDSYNQALEDAAKNVRHKIENLEIDKLSILKLKKV